jgi:hypothetical protein
MKSPHIVESALIGECCVAVVHVCEAQRWLLVYASPREPRLDILSEVIGKTGGHFGQVTDQVSIVYDEIERALAAFGLLVDALMTSGGMQRVASSETIN